MSIINGKNNTLLTMEGHIWNLLTPDWDIYLNNMTLLQSLVKYIIDSTSSFNHVN